jgi:hypothetical protein
MSAPEIGDRVCYWGRSERLVSGVLAERAIGPLTGNPRYRVVDSWREAADPDAGRWVGIELVHRIDPPEAGCTTRPLSRRPACPWTSGVRAVVSRRRTPGVVPFRHTGPLTAGGRT